MRRAAVIVAALLTTTASAAPAYADNGTPHVRATALDNRQSAHPRVQCGGGDGTLKWNGWGSITVRGYLKYAGDVYDYCPGGRVFLYLSWRNLGSAHNKRIGAAGPGKNVPVHFMTRSSWTSYTHIKLTACTNYGRWQCGKPVGP